MTREEEIKARMENGYIITTRTYIGPVDTLRADLAEEDVRYLLARNEELQRRVELMERVVGKARALSNTIGNPFAQNAMLHAALPRLIDNLQAELEGLDAKEQDDG